MDLLNRIEADSRVQKQVTLPGGRVIIKMPIDLIKHHPLLEKIRGKDIKTARLAASMKTTANAPMYPPLVYAEWDETEKLVKYYIADGHQRLKESINNKESELVVQVVVRWETPDDAFRECISIQYARFEMKDVDLFSILKQGKLSNQELSDATGIATTNIARMRTVAGYDYLIELIDQNAMSTNVASGLIDKCNSNGEKLAVLEATITKLTEEFKADALHYKNKYEKIGKPKDRKEADRAKWQTYFKGVEWKTIGDALEEDTVKTKKDGTLDLDKDAKAKAFVTVQETASAWEKVIPIVFSGGNQHGDMTLETLEDFRDALPMIKEKMDAIIAQRQLIEAKKAHPIPPGNPVEEIKPPKKPKKQSTDIEIE